MQLPILSLLIFFPVLGIVLLVFMNRKNHKLLKLTTMGISLVEFAHSLPLWFQFDSKTAAMQFTERHDWLPQYGISYILGLDGFSLLLVLLTTFLTPICVLATWGSYVLSVCRWMRLYGNLAAATLVLWGCCPQVKIVAIPPSDYRSDTAGLPLTEGSKSNLRGFLLAGGDQENIEVNAIDLNAPRYDSLLSLLSDTANLKIELLEDSRLFRAWFSEDPVYGVVDAREKSIQPLDPDRPVCFLTDDRYWWIFYREDAALKYLLVVKNMMRTPKGGQ